MLAAAALRVQAHHGVAGFDASEQLCSSSAVLQLPGCAALLQHISIVGRFINLDTHVATCMAARQRLFGSLYGTCVPDPRSRSQHRVAQHRLPLPSPTSPSCEPAAAAAVACWALPPAAKFVTQDVRLHEDRGAAGFVYSVVPSDPHKRGSYIHFCPPALVT
jgi:hypothetical protein